MKANTGISEEHTSATGLILNTLLADEQVLYVKTKNYHWNVTGPSFNDFHLFFDKQAEELEDTIDEVAERIRSLGHFAIGTMKDYLKLTRLLEHDSKMDDAITLVQNLLADHETIIKTLRNEIPVVGEKYKDIGTNDFLTGKLQQHEKMAWMLRAYLK
jgi:starvation-inducible DNA-binding protein